MSSLALAFMFLPTWAWIIILALLIASLFMPSDAAHRVTVHAT